MMMASSLLPSGSPFGYFTAFLPPFSFRSPISLFQATLQIIFLLLGSHFYKSKSLRFPLREVDLPSRTKISKISMQFLRIYADSLTLVIALVIPFPVARQTSIKKLFVCQFLTKFNSIIYSYSSFGQN